MSATPIQDEPRGRWLTFSAYATELGITRQALDLRVKQDHKTGTNKYKVFKGGGWNQDLQYAGASSRFMMSPSNGIHFVGFRIVLSTR